MADVTGTSGNDFLFFSGAITHFTAVLTNPYSGQTINYDGFLNLNTVSYDGLQGNDVLLLSSVGDGLFIESSAGRQMIASIEQIQAGDGSDIINLASTRFILSNVTIDGGAGNDILWSNAGNDTINGRAGDDIMDGGPGNDTLNGGIGNDWLSGGSGVDVLNGEDGDDTLSFFADGAWAAGAVAINAATGETVNISGMNQSLDTFNGGAGFDKIVMGDNGGVLQIDNGNGVARINGVEKIDGGAGNDVINLTSFTLAYGDVVVNGGGGNDTIWSGAGNDIISGGDGNDILNGGAGNDSLDGGAGDDTLIAGGGNDTLSGGAGNDTYVFAPGSGNTVLIRDSGGLDTLKIGGGLTAANLSFTQNGDDLFIQTAGGSVSIANFFSGGDAGAGYIGRIVFDDGSTFNTDKLLDHEPTAQNDDFAATQNHVLTGNVLLDNGHGADSDPDGDALSVQAGSFDLASGQVVLNADGSFAYTPVNGFLGTDTFTYTVFDGRGDSDTATVTLSVAALSGNGAFAGTEWNDLLYGGVGDDNISGLGGKDVIYGGAGNDVLNGGAGADILHGGDGNDTLMYSADGIWGDPFASYFAFNAGSPGVEGTGQYKNIDGLTQTHDAYVGGAGYDTLVLTGGNDALFLVDRNFDSVLMGMGTRLSGIEQIDAGDGNDVIDFTEYDISYGDIVMNGQAGNDYLWASSGNDALDGGTGKDNLYGGAGNDKLYGGDGNDILNGGPSATAAGALSTVTHTHNFGANGVVFPQAIKLHTGLGAEALGIRNHDLSVDYQTTATVTFKNTDAGYSNSMGHYNILADGTIGVTTLAFANAKTVTPGAQYTINLPGAPDKDFGFFIIANGYHQNQSFKNIDLAQGSFRFVYDYGTGGERAAKITDSADHVSLVYDNGAQHTVIKGPIYHTTSEGGSTAINPDHEVHVASGLVSSGNISALRIAFEDLPNQGDADFNDVVFDLSVASKTVTTVLINDNDYLSGGAGNDTLKGGVGDDVLVGGAGADILYGDQGADRFVFDTLDGAVDTVADFEGGGSGDVLDISQILSGYDPLHSALSNFVQIAHSGANDILKVNADGHAGGAFVSLAIISGGVGNATLADLIAAGNIFVNHT